MAIQHPIFQSLTIDGETSGLDPEWGQVQSSLTTAVVKANAWTSVGSLVLAPGLYIVENQATFTASTSVGTTQFGQRLALGSSTNILATNSFTDPVGYANGKALTALVNIEITSTLFGQLFRSREAAGECINRLRAVRLTDMIPNTI